MIYRFKVLSDRKLGIIEKEFYLTADSKSQLYHRVESQYRVPKNLIKIIEEIDDADISIDKESKDGKKEKSKLQHKRTKRKL